MLKSLPKGFKTHWKRGLSLLLVLLTVLGMFPVTAFASDAAPSYKPTGDFNVAPWTGGAVDGTGWVDKEHIFVNLPDVVPSIAYRLTNASGSVFTAADGTEIPGVTGKQFYPEARQFNVRLDRQEYIVPCMYTLAQRLAKAQKAAMSNGDTLVIYEAFRPAAVQSAVRDGLRTLISSNTTVSNDMKKASDLGYGQSWFIAGGTSNHQAGLAVDMTLAKGDPEELYRYDLDGAVYQKYEIWTEYDMPSQMHELSSAAIRWKSPVSSTAMPSNLDGWTDAFAASEGARLLQSYCTDAGLIPLASEWWHFNDPNAAKITAKGKYSKSVPINTAGDYSFSAAPSVTPGQALEQLVSRPAKNRVSTMSDDGGTTGGTGGLTPGSPGGQSPTRKDVAWTTDPERTFLRFTLIEFPNGVVTDLNNNDYETWHVVGTPLNVVWGQDSATATSSGRAEFNRAQALDAPVARSQGKYDKWDAEYCRSNVTWYNSCAMQYNGMGADAPQLMQGKSIPKGIYSYDATSGYNQRWVTTADEFQAATGISDYEKSQMFHCHASDWSAGWTNGDYTSMWGYNPRPVTPNNEYMVYTRWAYGS